MPPVADATDAMRTILRDATVVASTGRNQSALAAGDWMARDRSCASCGASVPSEGGCPKQPR